MLNVWSAISVLLATSNTDIRLCTLMLKRSGGSGEAAVLGTKPRSPKITMLCSMFGKAPVVCATVPSVPPLAKIVRGASFTPGVFTNAPRAKLNPVFAMGASTTWSTTVLVAVEMTSTTASRESSKMPSPTTGWPSGAHRERGAGTGGAAQIGAARRREAGARAGEEVRHVQ